MRTIELTDVAIKLDKAEVCGRPLNVGRPKGWEPPPQTSSAAAEKLSLAQQFAAQLSGGVTPVVVLENLALAGTIRDAEERNVVSMLRRAAGQWQLFIYKN